MPTFNETNNNILTRVGVSIYEKARRGTQSKTNYHNSFLVTIGKQDLSPGNIKWTLSKYAEQKYMVCIEDVNAKIYRIAFG